MKKASSSSSVESENTLNLSSQSSSDNLQKKSDKFEKSKKLFERVIKQFSLKRNIRTLFSDKMYTRHKEFEIFNAIKVLSITLIVLGNTFYYMIRGPLQNLEVVGQWFESSIFMFVLQADLQADIFYWMTGFLMSFYILEKLHSNGGNMWASTVRITFDRYLRLAPLYIFMIFFLWKFIGLFGGAGPRFYQFESKHGCQQYWMWHVLMLNNIFPWGTKDNCIEQSWYLANDIQFMVVCIILVQKYYISPK